VRSFRSKEKKQENRHTLDTVAVILPLHHSLDTVAALHQLQRGTRKRKKPKRGTHDGTERLPAVEWELCPDAVRYQAGKQRNRAVYRVWTHGNKIRQPGRLTRPPRPPPQTQPLPIRSNAVFAGPDSRLRGWWAPAPRLPYDYNKETRPRHTSKKRTRIVGIGTAVSGLSRPEIPPSTSSPLPGCC